MALKTTKQVFDCGKALTLCADAANDRLMKAIREDSISIADAEAAFNDEVALRQKANSILIQAARLAIEDLELPQAELLSVIRQAKKQIKEIQQITQALSLVANLIGLSSAVASARPGQVLSAVKDLRDNIKALREA